MALAAAASTASPSTTGTPTDKKMLAQNFDQFLTLLTAQLKNQNPLDPLSTNEFTAQLVQFASVEQQMKQNDSLTTLLTKTDASNAIGALNFVGRKVTASGTTTALTDGKADWVFDAPRAGTGTVTISDSKGKAVYQTTLALSGGQQSFSWDGKKSDGLTADNGLYTVSIEGSTVDGSAFKVKSMISGTVDGVDLYTAPPTLKIGSLTIDLSTVKSIGKP
ncbi:MAG: flagellar hook capping FlgD N-terminal domain-containing protein [Alphaproteobacteria bacterium]